MLKNIKVSFATKETIFLVNSWFEVARKLKEDVMKKLLILVLVLGIASAANATVSFVDSSRTAGLNTTITFDIQSDDTASYTRYVGNTPGIGDVTGMTSDAKAGPDRAVNESPYAYNGFWEIIAQDNAPETWDIQSGVHFTGTLTTFGSTGTYTINLYANDFVTVIDTLPVSIPEPMTIALLGLGGLFLRRRK